MSLSVASWLAGALELCALSETDRDYVMGRGASLETIEKWGIKTFETPPDPCPDESLHQYYGTHFDRFEGKTIYPLFSPRGRLLGFDSRTSYRKDEDRFLLGDAKWNPVWIGMPSAMGAVWEGRDIIIVEGRYDLWAISQATTRGQAILGSGPAHLSYKQTQFLKRWAKGDVYIAYDNDAAGKKGTEDAIKHLSCQDLRYGKSGDDPGLLWDEGGQLAVRAAFPYL